MPSHHQLEYLINDWTTGSSQRTLAGFPTFCPMTFHLFASYSLIAASSAALFLLISTGSFRSVIRYSLRPQQTQRSACPVWVTVRPYSVRLSSGMTYLVPMLFHTSFGSLREGLPWRDSLAPPSRSLYCARTMPSMMHLYLCDFAPAISRIPHLFQSQLFSRSPWCIRPTLLQLWLRRRGINISSLGRRAACLRLGAPSGARHVFLRLV
jgi:hypothetical protein